MNDDKHRDYLIDLAKQCNEELDKINNLWRKIFASAGIDWDALDAEAKNEGK